MNVINFEINLERAELERNIHVTFGRAASEASSKVKVKLSLYQAVKAHRAVRRRDSNIF
jgi:hypothetical protein